MPQLLPAPWFFIFISFWLLLIMLSPQKILSHMFLTDPLTKPLTTIPYTWTWPWP